MGLFHRLLKYPELWVLTILAFATRLWNIGWPPSVVFDEVYFRTFASNYLTGQYFFDIHPPLVKLLFASVASLFQLDPSQVVSGEPGTTILRIIPAVAGALLVLLVYIILRQLHFSRQIAALGSLLVLLDNALLVESRFVLMDSLLLLAGFGALSAYLAVRKARGTLRWVWIVVLAVLLGMLVTTKWTGLAIAGLLAFTWLIESIRSHKHRFKWRRMLGEALLTIGIIGAIYIGSFFVHFTLLTTSGEGDAFMSQQFQSTLVGNPAYNSSAEMAFWDKFIELNDEMYSAQSSLNDTEHPYASQWYSWPFMVRPVYYWQGDMAPSGAQGNIYMMGNPFVWLIGIIGVITALVVWLLRPKLLGQRRKLVAFLLAGYILNFLPFSLIDRPMFLYHYLFAFVISILIACVMFERLFKLLAKMYDKRTVRYTYWIMIAAVSLGFLYFLPLSYGWPLSPTDLQQHMWLPTWR